MHTAAQGAVGSSATDAVTLALLLLAALLIASSLTAAPDLDPMAYQEVMLAQVI